MELHQLGLLAVERPFAERGVTERLVGPDEAGMPVGELTVGGRELLRHSVSSLHLRVPEPMTVFAAADNRRT
jgi:hypothetical protein